MNISCETDVSFPNLHSHNYFYPLHLPPQNKLATQVQ